MVSFAVSTQIWKLSLTILGMNDVLPKPFTKEGLLNMLEKHLAHLKKQPPGLDMAVAPPSVIPAKRSLKSDDSPSTSPAATSNWNSPGGIAGMSPASTHPDDPYMQAVHNSAGPAPYVVQPPMQGSNSAASYGTSPTGSMPGLQGPRPPQPGQPHRRGMPDLPSGRPDMGGGGGDSKRQQMYAPGPLAPPPPSQMGQPMSMHQPR